MRCPPKIDRASLLPWEPQGNSGSFVSFLIGIFIMSMEHKREHEIISSVLEEKVFVSLSDSCLITCHDNKGCC